MRCAHRVLECCALPSACCASPAGPSPRITHSTAPAARSVHPCFIPCHVISLSACRPRCAATVHPRDRRHRLRRHPRERHRRHCRHRRGHLSCHRHHRHRRCCQRTGAVLAAAGADLAAPPSRAGCCACCCCACRRSRAQSRTISAACMDARVCDLAGGSRGVGQRVVPQRVVAPRGCQHRSMRNM